MKFPPCEVRSSIRSNYPPDSIAGRSKNHPAQMSPQFDRIAEKFDRTKRMSSPGQKRLRLSIPEDTQAPQDRANMEAPAADAARSPARRAHSPAPVSSPRRYDEYGLPVFQPPPPITNWRFGVREPSPPPALTDEERELEELWGEMEMALQSTEDNPGTPPPVAAEESVPQVSSTSSRQGSSSGEDSSSSD